MKRFYDPHNQLRILKVFHSNVDMNMKKWNYDNKIQKYHLGYFCIWKEQVGETIFLQISSKNEGENIYMGLKTIVNGWNFGYGIIKKSSL